MTLKKKIKSLERSWQVIMAPEENMDENVLEA